MTNGKRIIKGIAAAGAVLGGIDIFQDCGAVYAAELETTDQDDASEILAELEIEAESSTCRDMVYSESMLAREAVDGRGISGYRESMGSESANRTWSHSESITDGGWMGSEAMTASPARETGIRPESAMEMPGWQQMKSDLTHSKEAHYGEEWRPTHGYRGLGSWELTRKAVETACKNEGLELSAEELNQGANIWFYSGVTLQYMNEPYGSGWNGFAAWFRRVTGEKTPDFDEEAMERICTFLNRTATSEEKPPLSVKEE